MLSCIEDSYTTLIIYDCYNFKKMRNIPVSYFKLFATKIEWIENNSALVLYSQTEFAKVNVFTGERISCLR